MYSPFFDKEQGQAIEGFDICPVIKLYQRQQHCPSPDNKKSHRIPPMTLKI